MVRTNLVTMTSKVASSIAAWIIRTFGLKGSWKWAKRQMLKGKIIRRRSTEGCLKYRVDDLENGLLQSDAHRLEEYCHWRPANWFMSHELAVDYYVFDWINW